MNDFSSATRGANFLGNQAGWEATNAYQANFIGYAAGITAITANRSNFIGSQAGQAASNANNSNFLGSATGFSATNAYNSNFLGFNAGASATNANNSNFLGEAAGGSATNAKYSNFIGYAAGQNAYNASYSTLIGYNVASRYTTSGISVNNIIIGTNITLPDNSQNSINIGGILFGTGSYIQTSSLLPFSGSANGRIGINVVSPNYNLDVSGSGNYTNGLTVTGSITTTGGSITLATGSINITSGSITMPNRPAFRVTGAGGGKTAVTTLSGSYLNVDYQQGGGWNNSTGTFTAPIAGLYQVNLVTRTNSNSLGTISQLIVYKNNTGGVTGTPQIMIEFGANTTMNHAGGSTISKLEVGDTLKMVVAVGEISFDQNDNFSVAYIG